MTEIILKYWLEFLFSGILFVISFVLKNVTREVKCEITEQKAIKAGMHALLRDRIIQSYNFYTARGYCEIHDRDNLINLYKQYHELGANGVMDNLIEELNRLPVKKREDR